MMNTIGTIAAFLMPFFNIPMITHLLKRKRSVDFSLSWIGGVWTCTILMTPRAITSEDLALKLFGYSNLILFSMVTCLVFYYRVRPGNLDEKVK